jgi:3-hydroxyisobutyrate dehydrogenase-like beta-hydroxyacid dehydrogenase
MRAAVIGLGNMGRAFAGRCLDQGHEVVVWNRSPGKAGELVARGAREASDPAEAVRDVEVVLVVLTDDDAVSSVVFGDHGIAAAVADGAVLANVSTVSPGLARRLAADGPSGRVLDTPVLGAPTAIESGKGRFLVGGPAEALAKVAPLLDDLGASTIHCGGPGAGAVMKLVSNLLLVTGVAAMAEGIAIARSHGIDEDLLRRAFGDSPVLSQASLQRLGPVLDPEHPGWFGPSLARKDVRLAASLAEEGGARAVLATAVDGLLTELIDSGREWPDFAAVIEALSK